MNKNFDNYNYYQYIEQLSPEVVQVTLACVQSFVVAFLGYASLITGLEMEAIQIVALKFMNN